MSVIDGKEVCALKAIVSTEWLLESWHKHRASPTQKRLVPQAESSVHTSTILIRISVGRVLDNLPIRAARVPQVLLSSLAWPTKPGRVDSLVLMVDTLMGAASRLHVHFCKIGAARPRYVCFGIRWYRHAGYPSIDRSTKSL